MASIVLSLLDGFRQYMQQIYSVSEEQNNSISPAQNVTRNLSSFPVKLVIFDKDGTLTCFHSMWAPWCEQIVQLLEEKTGLNLQDKVYDFFKYNPRSGRIEKGPVAEDTQDVVKRGLIKIVNEECGIPCDEARGIIMNVWDLVSSKGLIVKPTCNVKEVFSTLKSFNVKIAICTSDDRCHTMQAIDALEIKHLVDFLLCGDDPDNHPKPAPNNVHLICSKLEVDIRQSAVIGDTPTDMQMGHRSGVGIVVGVLSGVGTKSDLSTHADVLVENVEDALPLFLNSDIFPEVTNDPNLKL